jgi:hypothetical protein
LEVDVQLTVVRDVFGKEWTQGKLFVDDAFLCYTLEDTDRFLEDDSGTCQDCKKVYGKTAIPRGVYKVILSESARFNKVLPLLQNVPDFEGVRIHAGNTNEDTEGCILVGMNRLENGTITQSQIAIEHLMSLLTNSKTSIVLEVK